MVPVDLPPESDLPDGGYGLRSQGEIRDILLLARQHTKEMEGVFNLEELNRYLRYVRDYEEIVIHIQSLLNKMIVNRDYALRFSSALAGMVEEHLRLTIPRADISQHKKSTGKLSLRSGEMKLKIV